MGFKVGDKVRVKPEKYIKEKLGKSDEKDLVKIGNKMFCFNVSTKPFFNKVFTIKSIVDTDGYIFEEDKIGIIWPEQLLSKVKDKQTKENPENINFPKEMLVSNENEIWFKRLVIGVINNKYLALDHGEEKNFEKGVKFKTSLFSFCKEDNKENEFKPFDKIIVRNTGCEWRASLYSHYDTNSNLHTSINGYSWNKCIMYNENTKHLLGTKKDYQ